MAKIQMNKAQDAQGFTDAVEDSPRRLLAMMNYPGYVQNADGERRLGPVALAAKGLKRRARRAELKSRGRLSATSAPPPSRRAPA